MAESNKLFEGMDLTGIPVELINNSKKLYNYIVESSEKALEEGIPFEEAIDEGIFSGLLMGAVGATAGPAIMKAVCKVLGITENSTLGQLLTSRLVIGAICGELGLRM